MLTATASSATTHAELTFKLSGLIVGAGVYCMRKRLEGRRARLGIPTAELSIPEVHAVNLQDDEPSINPNVVVDGRENDGLGIDLLRLTLEAADNPERWDEVTRQSELAAIRIATAAIR